MRHCGRVEFGTRATTKALMFSPAGISSTQTHIRLLNPGRRERSAEAYAVGS
jgi:hypothetical protein